VKDEANQGGKAGCPLRILVADADCALFGLIEEWLASLGGVLVGACCPDDEAHNGYDVIVADLPLLKDLAREHPGTPIVALSANLLPGVEPAGSLARELGVTSVLPKPVTREALVGAVRRAVQDR